MEENLQILFDTVEFGWRHHNYDAAQQVSKFAKMIVTGEGQHNMLHEFRLHENDDLKAQRERLTNTYTRFAASQVRKYFSKVRRVDGVTQNIEGVSEQDEAVIKEKLGKFHGEKDLDDFLFDTIERLTFVDPNAFIVCERKDYRDTENAIIDVDSYPFVVPSESAINYEYRNGQLQFLIVHQQREERIIKGNSSSTVHLDDYYYYLPNVTYLLSETIEKEPESLRFNNKQFVLERYETGAGEIPAMQVGVYESDLHKGLFVTPLEQATEVFKDMIRDKSFLDLAKALHLFLQRYEYTKPCKYEDERGNTCEGGMIRTLNGRIRCPQCEGSGNIRSATQQQTVGIKMPKDPTQVFELSKLVHYVDLPNWLPQWLSSEVDALVKRVGYAVFNTNIVKENVTAKTATEVQIEYDKIYDVITPYAIRISQFIEKFIRVTGNYLGLDAKGVHKFPSDFKMKSLQELISDYQNAKNAGLSNSVLWGIQCDILAKLYKNTPEKIDSIKAQNKFKPFRSLSEEQTSLVLSSRRDNDYDKVLFENFDRVFFEIDSELEQPFYMLNEIEQTRLVNTKVTELAERFAPESALQLPIEDIGVQ